MECAPSFRRTTRMESAHVFVNYDGLAGVSTRTGARSADAPGRIRIVITEGVIATHAGVTVLESGYERVDKTPEMYHG